MMTLAPVCLCPLAPVCLCPLAAMMQVTARISGKMRDCLRSAGVCDREVLCMDILWAALCQMICVSIGRRRNDAKPSYQRSGTCARVIRHKPRCQNQKSKTKKCETVAMRYRKHRTNPRVAASSEAWRWLFRGRMTPSPRPAALTLPPRRTVTSGGAALPKRGNHGGVAPAGILIHLNGAAVTSGRRDNEPRRQTAPG